jgi:8-oxo-dGTP pyrophosphatase MutT (NUDIX family)
MGRGPARRPYRGPPTNAAQMIRPSIECWLVRRAPTGAEVLLLHAPNAPGKHPPLWQPVSGGIEPGEDARAACRREVHEEAGLDLAADALVCVIDQITIAARPGLTLDKTVFAAIAPAGEIRIDVREHDGHEWVPVDAVAGRLLWDSHRTTWARVAPVIAQLPAPPAA